MMAQPQIIADSAIRNAVYLEGLKANEVREVAKFLKKMDKSIRDRLLNENLEQWNRRRLEKLLAMVRSDIAGIQGEYIARLSNDVMELAEYQAAFEVKNFSQIGVEIDLPSPQQIKTAVFSTPMSVRGAQGGKLMEPFAKDWAVAEQDAIVGAIRQGYFEGQSIFQIVQRIRGTKARNYKDGILNTTRHHAEAVARTMLQHASTQARHATWDRHPDVVQAYQWSSVLDSRTSTICRTLDGQIWKQGEGPKPPAHINCRSLTIPILSDDLQFLSKGRTRVSKPGDSGGPPVAQDKQYYDWLKEQSPEFQDSVLGPKRGQLFRDGGLSTQRFAELQLGKNFKPLTLEEMRKLEPLAFNKAFPVGATSI